MELRPCPDPGGVNSPLAHLSVAAIIETNFKRFFLKLADDTVAREHGNKRRVRAVVASVRFRQHASRRNIVPLFADAAPRGAVLGGHVSA
jgi:hypothetical protein